jgi:hypothetical protein
MNDPMMQPLLYCLLGVAILCRLLTLLDLALLCWKAFHECKDWIKVIALLTNAGATDRGFQPHKPTQQTTAKTY